MNSALASKNLAPAQQETVKAYRYAIGMLCDTLQKSVDPNEHRQRS